MSVPLCPAKPSETAHRHASVSAWATMVEWTAANIWLAGVDGCRAGWIVAFVRPDRRRGAHPRRCRTFPTSLTARRNTRRSSPSTCRSACRSAPAMADARPRMRSGRCSARGNPRCFRCRRARRCRRTDYREACEIALATSDPPRKISKQLFMIAPKIREVDACLARRRGAGRARARSPSGTGVLAAQWRAGADRAEEGQKPPLRAGTGASPRAS